MIVGYGVETTLSFLSLLCFYRWSHEVIQSLDLGQSIEWPRSITWPTSCDHHGHELFRGWKAYLITGLTFFWVLMQFRSGRYWAQDFAPLHVDVHSLKRRSEAFQRRGVNGVCATNFCWNLRINRLKTMVFHLNDRIFPKDLHPHFSPRISVISDFSFVFAPPNH